MSRTARTDAEIRHIQDRILDAAARVFSQHGVAGVSMEQIAREADYSVASLYNYFSGRHAVVLALVDRSIQRIEDVLRLPMPRSLSPEQRLESILLRFLGIAGDQLWLTDALLGRGAIDRGAEEISARYWAMMDGVMATLQDQVVRVPGIQPAQARRLTIHFVGMVRSESFAWNDTVQPDDMGGVAEDLMTFWLAGARALGAASGAPGAVSS